MGNSRPHESERLDPSRIHRRDRTLTMHNEAAAIPAIVEMTIGDFDEVIAFWKTQAGGGLNESDTREGIASFLSRNPGMSFIVRAGGRVIAAVLGGHDGRRGYLHHLAVAASHRGRGIGRALVRRCIDCFTRDGIARCSVFVYNSNESGHDFWEAMGFAHRADLKLLQRPTLLKG